MARLVLAACACWVGGSMRLVLEVFGAWCGASFAVSGGWALVIYLGHCYTQARNARRWAGMIETD
jgi:hypothetical protein